MTLTIHEVKAAIKAVEHVGDGLCEIAAAIKYHGNMTSRPR